MMYGHLGLTQQMHAGPSKACVLFKSTHDYTHRCDLALYQLHLLCHQVVLLLIVQPQEDVLLHLRPLPLLAAAFLLFGPFVLNYCANLAGVNLQAGRINLDCGPFDSHDC